MTTMNSPTTLSPSPSFTNRVPPLQSGDRLARDEFERRYNAAPRYIRAELVEGIVYVMVPPVSDAGHARPHGRFVTWLGVYELSTPGIGLGDNATVRLDADNEFQPDSLLKVLPECGGQSRSSSDDFIEGAPELVAEIAASSVSYDLGKKLEVYCRTGVREYIVWRTWDQAIDWFALREGKFVRQTPDSQGLHKSEVFPGLWLDPVALLAGNGIRVLEVLQQGIASQEHGQFVQNLAMHRG